MKNIRCLVITGKGKQSRLKQRPYQISVPLISLRALLATLLLLIIMGYNSELLVKTAYARSTCGVLLMCPTPTPNPLPTPTPQPLPTPQPVATPTPQLIPTPTPNPVPGTTPAPQPNPTTAAVPGLAPTITTKASPTVSAKATPTRVGKTPAPASTPIPATHDAHENNQSVDSGFSQMLMIIAIVFLCLLFGLAIGLWFFRRKLLPPINVKKPVSGVSSWTRTLKPDGTTNTDSINSVSGAGNPVSALGAEDYSADTIASSSIGSPQLVLSNTANIGTNNIRTAPNLPAHNVNNPWYDVSDEPFKV